MEYPEKNKNITRYFFEAPKEVVFEAFTDAHKLSRWWGPHGFTSPVADFEARPGGRIHVDMRGPDGAVYPMHGTVEEIEPPDRLVITTAGFTDESGAPQLIVRNSLTFEEENGGTTVTSEAVIIKASQRVRKEAEGMEAGWRESQEKLEDFLARSRAASHLSR